MRKVWKSKHSCDIINFEKLYGQEDIFHEKNYDIGTFYRHPRTEGEA